MYCEERFRLKVAETEREACTTMRRGSKVKVVCLTLGVKKEYVPLPASHKIKIASLGVKRQGLEAGNLFTFSAKTKNNNTIPSLSDKFACLVV
jgi:hypothetical protein